MITEIEIPNGNYRGARKAYCPESEATHKDQRGTYRIVHDINKPIPSAKLLEQLLYVARLSLREIGEEFGVTGQTISNWLKRYGIVLTKAESNKIKSIARLRKYGKFGRAPIEWVD